MKHRYITLQTMLTCLANSAPQKDIYAQLEETIAERKKIMKQLENFSKRAKVIDMYLGATKAA